MPHEPAAAPPALSPPSLRSRGSRPPNFHPAGVWRPRARRATPALLSSVHGRTRAGNPGASGATAGDPVNSHRRLRADAAGFADEVDTLRLLHPANYGSRRVAPSQSGTQVRLGVCRPLRVWLSRGRNGATVSILRVSPGPLTTAGSVFSSMVFVTGKPIELVEGILASGWVNFDCASELPLHSYGCSSTRIPAQLRIQIKFDPLE